MVVSHCNGLDGIIIFLPTLMWDKGRKDRGGVGTTCELFLTRPNGKNLDISSLRCVYIDTSVCK